MMSLFSPLNDALKNFVPAAQRKRKRGSIVAHLIKGKLHLKTIRSDLIDFFP